MSVGLDGLFSVVMETNCAFISHPNQLDQGQMLDVMRDQKLVEKDQLDRDSSRRQTQHGCVGPCEMVGV